MRVVITLLRFFPFIFFVLFFQSPTAALPSTSLGNSRLIKQRNGARTTENGLSTNKCKPVTLIYAKGTSEVGNVGPYVGPAFISSLRGQLGSGRIMVQGVAYDASVTGYLGGGDSDGSALMLNLIQKVAAKCHSTQIVLGGYSQGAQLVHNAASQLSAGIVSRIIAVVLFGDPYFGRNVGPMSPSDSRIYSLCHQDDVVCTGSGGYDEHYTYNKDAGAAAKFVVDQTQ